MAVSIRDIAERAGVSRGTVSKVLNGSSEPIGQHTKERVRLAVDELGYRPNLIARSLGRRRTDTIGLLIRDLSNPFFVDLMRSAQLIAQQSGYQVITDTSLTRPTSERHFRFSGWPIDGVLIWCADTQNAGMFLGSQAAGLATVYLGSARTDGADYAAFDRYSGTRDAMEYLVRSGHRRIGFASPSGIAHDPKTEGRYAAYVDVCAAHALSTEGMIIPVDVDGAGINDSRIRAAGLEAGMALTRLPESRRPTAVQCYNDLTAISLLHGVRRGGLRVPEDVAIIGFDGIDEGLYLDKPLATVETPVEPLITRALDILHKRISEGSTTSPLQDLVPSRFRNGETA